MKRFLWMMAAAALMVTACGRHAAPQMVRLMTYNVGAFGKELDDSTPMIAAMIAELGAETVGLNELDSCNRRHNVNQVEQLAAELNKVGEIPGQARNDGKGIVNNRQSGPDPESQWSGRFGRAMSYAGGAYGCGIVTRAKILDHFNIALPKEEGSEPRVCVVVETPRYVYAVCHLDHIGDTARLVQARVLTEELQRRYGAADKPVFLAGDFNDTPDSPVIRQLSRDWTLLSPLADSYSAKDPHVCIDYIFALHNGVRIAVQGGAVARDFRSGDVTVASDHLPVYVDVAF